MTVLFDQEDVAAAVAIVLGALVIVLGLTLAFGFIVYEVVVHSTGFWR